MKKSLYIHPNGMYEGLITAGRCMAAFRPDSLGGWGVCGGGHPEKTLLEPLRKTGSVWSGPGSPVLSGRESSHLLNEACQGTALTGARSTEGRPEHSREHPTFSPSRALGHPMTMMPRLPSLLAASEFFSVESSGNHHTDWK